MKAVILAGGFGTKLRSIAFEVPKPMVPILGIPFLEYQMRMLKENGIVDIVLCVHYMAEKIKSYFGSGKRLGIDITYSEEDIPLGTAGAVKKAEKHLDDIFIVLNGDSYTNLNLKNFLDFHKSKNSLCTIALNKNKNKENYGSVILNNEGKVTDFIEGSKSDIPEEYLINTGFYVFDKRILSFIASEKNVSLEKDIFPKLAKEGNIYGYESKDYFIDVGRPESYDKFKQDVLNALILKETDLVGDAMRKIIRNGIDFIIISDESKKLLGIVNDRIIKEFILKGGIIDSPLRNVMIRDPITAKNTDDSLKIKELLMSGIRYLPIISEDGKFSSVEVRSERLKTENFPVIRGRAPMRIGFAGGGTDLSYFFDKHGGAVISATIDKYCYATIIKRADNKIIIDSDASPDLDILVESIDSLKYDGKLDLVKAIINTMHPDFGFEIYLHNDIPPGRGLGASASLSVLIAKILAKMMDVNYDDYMLAEIAYKAEREELKIKGGWQDQYSAVIGGFNFMEFNSDKTIVYPLRLKEDFIKELNHHLLLCYIGKSHSSGEVHKKIEQSFMQNEEKKIENLNNLKMVALEIKDSLLKEKLEDFGRLLRDSWEYKRNMSGAISDSLIDNLYKIGIQNGAYGGKLLGAGNGGYILFFYSPRKRNQLKNSLENAGGEILNFSFESRGADIWTGKNKF